MDKFFILGGPFSDEYGGWGNFSLILSRPFIKEARSITMDEDVNRLAIKDQNEEVCYNLFQKSSATVKA